MDLGLILAIAGMVTTFLITALVKTIGKIYDNVLKFRDAHVTKEHHDAEISKLRKEMREDMLMYKIELQEQANQYITNTIDAKTTDLTLLKERAFNMEGLAVKIEAKYETIENITDKVINTETVVRSLEKRMDQVQYGGNTTNLGRRKE